MPTSPRVTPRTRRPPYDITLSDGRRTYGLRVEPSDIKEVPQTPSTLHLTAGGGSASKYGDFDPTMAQLVQSDWSGGRGQTNFSDDPSRFFDSQNAWTVTPDKLLQGNWVANSQRSVRSVMGYTHSPLQFIGLIGSSRYQAMYRVAVTSFNADKVYLWIRRAGSPGTLTVELRTDNAGTPSATVLKSATVTTADITDWVSVFKSFDWSGTQAIVATTAYHIVIYGASTDNATNHWEVGSDPTAGGNFSSDGSSWTSGVGLLNFRAVDADIDRKFFFFTLDGLLYAVDKRADGTASHLYVNGWRGKATSAASTTLTDTNQSFVGNMGRVFIISGTGAGQSVRNTSSFTSTQITVDSAWDITPDNTSEYIVVSTDWFEITGHGLTKPVTSVCVTGTLPAVAYLAQGNATTIRRMRFNASASPPAHEFADDGSNTADLLFTYYDYASKSPIVWRAINATTVAVSRTKPPAEVAADHHTGAVASGSGWGTNLTFGDAIPVGSKQYEITGLTDYDDKLYVAKEDSLWVVVDDTPHKLPVGLDSSPNINNGKAIISSGLFLYFNYMHSLEKLYGTTLDDIGPWKGAGIPSGRTGTISAIVSLFNWLICAIDAGTTGTSSVMLYDGIGWHELFRAHEVGQRIRGLGIHSVEGLAPRLWINAGSDLWLYNFPKDTLNPLNDSSFEYQHEAVLVMSTIDFGNARLPKLFKEIAALNKNLASGTYIAVDYQLDADIGGTTWQQLGSLLQSPEDTLPMGFGNARQIRIRLRLITKQANTPTEVRAIIVEGYSRTPVKYQYNIRLQEKKNPVNRRGGRDVDADVLYNWLREKANGAGRVLMRSRYKSMDNRYVIVEPPILNRKSADSEKSKWSGDLLITLRDE